jgi:hypothetical protein
MSMTRLQCRQSRDAETVSTMGKDIYLRSTNKGLVQLKGKGFSSRKLRQLNPDASFVPNQMDLSIGLCNPPNFSPARLQAQEHNGARHVPYLSPSIAIAFIEMSNNVADS